MYSSCTHCNLEAVIRKVVEAKIFVVQYYTTYSKYTHLKLIPLRPSRINSIMPYEARYMTLYLHCKEPKQLRFLLYSTILHCVVLILYPTYFILKSLENVRRRRTLTRAALMKSGLSTVLIANPKIPKIDIL